MKREHQNTLTRVAERGTLGGGQSLMNRRTILRWPLPPAFRLLNYKNYHGGVAGAGKCRRVLHHLTEAQRRESIPQEASSVLSSSTPGSEKQNAYRRPRRAHNALRRQRDARRAEEGVKGQRATVYPRL